MENVGRPVHSVDDRHEGRMSRVGDLNEAVHNQLGILPERQLIRYAGRLLLAGRRLADYGIEDESWLDLGLRLMGGSASPASGAEAWRGVPDAVGCAVDQRVPMSIGPIAPPSPQAADGQPGRRRRSRRRNRSRSRMGAPPPGDEPSQGTQLAADVGRLRIAEARGSSGTQRRHYCPVVSAHKVTPLALQAMPLERRMTNCRWQAMSKSAPLLL